MDKPLRFVLQLFNYTIFMAVVWYFSFAPPFRQLNDDQAVITLAFGHAGERREDCRQLSHEELMKLPPNMRAPSACPRARSPVDIELLLDGESIVRKVVRAPGLYEDQSVHVFENVKVPSGEHHLVVRMNDNVRVEGPTHTHEQTVTLEPAQRVVIDFRSDEHRFIVGK